MTADEVAADNIAIIGASRSKPHTNNHYAMYVCMYVCAYVPIRHSTCSSCARALYVFAVHALTTFTIQRIHMHIQLVKNRQRSVCVQ